MFSPRILKLGAFLIDRGAWYLAPFSWIYAFVVFVRNGLYDWGWLSQMKVNATVVSVGNIVAGGSGKTPLVRLLAQTFAHRKVAVLSRGYGEIPDEPLLLQRQGIQVYVGKNRVRLASQAILEGADLLILDDGFQYRALRRDFDIVLSKSAKHYLPWGYLRDSPKRRADLVVTPEIKVERVVDLEGREVSLEEVPVGLFCGIGSPESFRKTVVSLKAKIVDEWILADHEKADPKRLERFARRAQRKGAKALVCTEKDAVKLEPTSLPIYVIEISLAISHPKKEWEELLTRIDRHRVSGV